MQGTLPAASGAQPALSRSTGTGGSEARTCSRAQRVPRVWLCSRPAWPAWSWGPVARGRPCPPMVSATVSRGQLVAMGYTVAFLGWLNLGLTLQISLPGSPGQWPAPSHPGAHPDLAHPDPDFHCSAMRQGGCRARRRRASVLTLRRSQCQVTIYFLVCLSWPKFPPLANIYIQPLGWLGQPPNTVT